MEYDYDKQLLYVFNVIDINFNFFNNLKTNGIEITEELIEKCTNTFINQLAILMFGFKHESFKEEKEWRIIDLPAPENEYKLIKFRNSCGKLLPYVEIAIFINDNDVEKLPIKKIIFGPLLNKELTYKSLDLLTKRHQYKDVVIEKSKIPLG